MHTPASNDCGKGQQQKQLKERTPRQWLLDYKEEGGRDAFEERYRRIVLEGHHV